jgi:hypothetical protein
LIQQEDIMEVEGALALQNRVMERLSARMDPPPKDWVEPERVPLKEGEAQFSDPIVNPLTTALDNAWFAMLGLPPRL